MRLRVSVFELVLQHPPKLKAFSLIRPCFCSLVNLLSCQLKVEPGETFLFYLHSQRLQILVSRRFTVKNLVFAIFYFHNLSIVVE